MAGTDEKDKKEKEGLSRLLVIMAVLWSILKPLRSYSVGVITKKFNSYSPQLKDLTPKQIKDTLKKEGFKCVKTTIAKSSDIDCAFEYAMLVLDPYAKTGINSFADIKDPKVFFDILQRIPGLSLPVNLEGLVKTLNKHRNDCAHLQESTEVAFKEFMRTVKDFVEVICLPDRPDELEKVNMEIQKWEGRELFLTDEQFAKTEIINEMRTLNESMLSKLEKMNQSHDSQLTEIKRDQGQLKLQVEGHELRLQSLESSNNSPPLSEEKDQKREITDYKSSPSDENLQTNQNIISPPLNDEEEDKPSEMVAISKESKIPAPEDIGDVGVSNGGSKISQQDNIGESDHLSLEPTTWSRHGTCDDNGDQLHPTTSALPRTVDEYQNIIEAVHICQNKQDMEMMKRDTKIRELEEMMQEKDNKIHKQDVKIKQLESENRKISVYFDNALSGKADNEDDEQESQSAESKKEIKSLPPGCSYNMDKSEHNPFEFPHGIADIHHLPNDCAII